MAVYAGSSSGGYAVLRLVVVAVVLLGALASVTFLAASGDLSREATAGIIGSIVGGAAAGGAISAANGGGRAMPSKPPVVPPGPISSEELPNG